MRRRPSSAARRTPAPAARLCAPASLAAHTRARPPRAPASAQAVRLAATQRRSRARGRLPGSAATCPGRPRALGAAGGRGAGRRPPDSPLAWPGRPGPPRSRARDRRARDWPGWRARELLPGGGLLAPSFWIHLLPPHLLPLPSRGTLGGEEFSVCSHPAPGAKLARKTGRYRGGARRAPPPATWAPANPLVPAPRRRAHNSGCLRRSGSGHSPAALCRTGLGGRRPLFCRGWGEKLRDVGRPDKGVSPPAALQGSFLR